MPPLSGLDWSGIPSAPDGFSTECPTGFEPQTSPASSRGPRVACAWVLIGCCGRACLLSWVRVRAGALSRRRSSTWVSKSSSSARSPSREAALTPHGYLLNVASVLIRCPVTSGLATP